LLAPIVRLPVVESESVYEPSPSVVAATGKPTNCTTAPSRGAGPEGVISVTTPESVYTVGDAGIGSGDVGIVRRVPSSQADETTIVTASKQM
jgi:hypothetical protein